MRYPKSTTRLASLSTVFVWLCLAVLVYPDPTAVKVASAIGLGALIAGAAAMAIWLGEA